MVAPATPVRRPPYSAEAEMAVLGAILRDENTIDQAAALLPDEAAFYREPHRRLYRALRGLREKGSAIDEVTVSEALHQAGDYDVVGGIVFLAQLLDACPSAANVEYHAAIVADRFALRRMREAAEGIILLTESGAQAPQVYDQAEAAVMALSLGRGEATGPSRLKELLWPAFERIENIQNSESDVCGLPSGFDDVDDLTSGYQEGELILLAGRPGMGKSSFLYANALNIAVRQQKPVGLFSLEVDKQGLVHKLLSIEARVNLKHMRRRKGLRDDDYARLAIAAGHLNNAPIHIDDTAGITIAQLRAEARRMKAAHPDLALIGVDYLQLMESASQRRSGTREQDVSEVSKGLKNLARELAVPVIALSQLSRAVENRTDKIPQLSDLRESGSLEQDADVVLFLYRPEYYFGPVDKQGNSIEGVAELIPGKQRNGEAGYGARVPMRFLKETTTFESWHRHGGR